MPVRLPAGVTNSAPAAPGLDKPDGSASSSVPIKIRHSNTTGDAHIACTRGKVKYIHDIGCKLNWSFTLNKGSSSDEDHPEHKAKGSISFDNDGNGDWDAVVEVDKGNEWSDCKKVIAERVKKEGGELQKAIEKRLRAIEKEFQAIGQE